MSRFRTLCPGWRKSGELTDKHLKFFSKDGDVLNLSYFDGMVLFGDTKIWLPKFISVMNRQSPITAFCSNGHGLHNWIGNIEIFQNTHSKVIRTLISFFRSLSFLPISFFFFLYFLLVSSFFHLFPLSPCSLSSLYSFCACPVNLSIFGGKKVLSYEKMASASWADRKYISSFQSIKTLFFSFVCLLIPYQSRFTLYATTCLDTRKSKKVMSLNFVGLCRLSALTIKYIAFFIVRASHQS